MEIIQPDVKNKAANEALNRLDEYISLHEKNSKKTPTVIRLYKNHYDALLKIFGKNPPKVMTRNNVLVRYSGQPDEPVKPTRIWLDGYIHSELNVATMKMNVGWITPNGEVITTDSELNIKGEILKVVKIVKSGVYVVPLSSIKEGNIAT